MDNKKIIKLWEELENQKCIDCIFTIQCDILTSNYKNDICQTIQNQVEEMEE